MTNLEIFNSDINTFQTFVANKTSTYHPTVPSIVSLDDYLTDKSNKEVVKSLIHGDFGCQTISVVHLISSVFGDPSVVNSYHGGRKIKDSSIEIPRFVLVKTKYTMDKTPAGTFLLVSNNFCINNKFDYIKVESTYYKTVEIFNNYFMIASPAEVTNFFNSIKSFANTVTMSEIMAKSSYNIIKSYI